MAVNLVCVPVIWVFYPETKGRPLEDMDVLFGGVPGVSTEALGLLTSRDRDGRDSPTPKDPDSGLDRDIQNEA